jgi:hypothetical protein
MKLYKEREKYWWYRLLQTIFIIVFLIIVIAIGIIGWYDRPQINEYESTYRVRCNDNELTFGQLTNKEIYVSSREIINDELEDMAKLRCVFPKLETEFLLERYRKGQYDQYIPTTKNYNLEISEPAIQGSWISAIKTWVIGIILTLVGSYLVILIFNYVVFGRKPKYNIGLSKTK